MASSDGGMTVSDTSDVRNARPEPDETVQRFVERYVSPGRKKYPLDRVYREYSARYPRSVREEDFRWHLENSLPATDAATWTTGDYVVGVTIDYV